MEKKEIKKAFNLAEEEIKKDQINKIKDIVKITLEKIENLDKKVKELQNERKLLKLDIDDLKEGRLDRIEDRQKIDAKAKEVSVITVIKEQIVREIPVYPWHWPYIVTIKEPYWIPGAVYYASSNNLTSATTVNTFITDGSSFKTYVTGSYMLANGNTVHLR